MRARLVAAIEFGVLLVLCGCERQQASPPMQSTPVVQPRAEDAAAPPLDAGWQADAEPAPMDERDAEPAPMHERDAEAAPMRERDAEPPARSAPDPAPREAEPSSNADAGARDGAAGSGSDDHDAGPGTTEPDAAPTEPIAPRTDGCPEDAPLPLDRVRVLAAPGQSESIVGARIQGSNAGPTTDFVDLATLEQVPAAGTFTELRLENTLRYRYIRYYAPPGSQGGVAEVEFFSGGRRLEGQPFGTANADLEKAFARALDADPATYFAPNAQGGGYVGLDIARGYVTEPVAFSPAASSFSEPVSVALTSATARAVVRYTTDDSDPAKPSALTYDAPIRLPRGRTTLRAFAASECRFDSPIRSATYTVDPGSEPNTKGLRSYHIGNSLTDTINHWLEPIADSTGIDHVYARWTIPGAPIKWLAEHQGQGFADPQGAASFDSFVASFAPIDHLSIQPYSDPAFESQGGAAVGLLTTALRFSPQVQFWIYAQWPGRTEWATDSFSVGGGTVYPAWQVPRAPSNWEDGTENALLYCEAFRDYVDARVGGKPLRIVPAGLALVELKRRMDAGAIPGLARFFDTMFEDEAHLLPPAQYLVALVFYVCLYRESPVGRVTSAGSGLTAEQARIFQQIAWDVASSYPGSGVLP